MNYATPAELATYLDPDSENPTPPPLATVLVRKASQLVLDATAGAPYGVDEDGYPVDAYLRNAMREATLEQASAWSLHGIDPRKGAAGAPRRVSSKALNGAQASYVADPQADTALSALWAGDSLTSAALAVLRNAGLITTRVNGGRRWPSRPYDRVVSPGAVDIDGGGPIPNEEL